jgi:aminoglycoside phosphotransferase (APT) family kinase protein
MTVTTSHSKWQLDLRAVESWLASTLGMPVQLRRSWLISGGRSNLTYGLETTDGTWMCLRRPPLGRIASSAHNIAREYTILSALRSSATPVPDAIALCHDDGVIGSTFYVMSFVDGTVYSTKNDVLEVPLAVRHQIGREVIAKLDSIHRVDLQLTGLDSLTRPGSYVARQIRRWTSQLSDPSVIQGLRIRAVAEELRRLEPASSGDVLLHGDFKLANCLLDPDGKIVAVLDWELSAIGDPLADLGWLIASWSEPGDHAARIVEPPARAGGFMSRHDLASEYAAVSGRPVAGLDYYVALAHWRWACIDVGIHSRFRSGAMAGQQIDLAQVEAEIDDRLATAQTLLSAVGVDL